MKKIIGFSFLILAVALFSCQNDKVSVSTDEELMEKAAQITLTETNLEALSMVSEYEVEFYGNAEGILSHWWRMGKKWQWTNKLHYMANKCPDVTIIEGGNDGYPKTIRLNYGDGTELKNQKVLSGIIIIEISGPRNSSSFTRMVTYDNFAIDTVQIAGTSLIEINKENELFRNYTSDLTFTINGDVVSQVVTRSANRTWTWVEGMETTEDQTDDVIKIAGVVNAASGTDTYKKEIIDDLVRKGDCRYIVSGVVEVTLIGDLVSTLDYGTGDCDEIAVLTNADGTTVDVDLSVCKRKENKFRDKNEKG